MSGLKGRQMSDNKDIDNKVVEAYAIKVNVNLEEGRRRLEENYKKEVESVDAKEVALKCIKALRIISPKVTGLELREIDTIHRVNDLIRDIKAENREIKEENREIKEENRKVIRSVYDLLNSMCEEADKLRAEVDELKTQNTKGFFGWIFRFFRNFLMNKKTN